MIDAMTSCVLNRLVCAEFERCALWSCHCAIKRKMVILFPNRAICARLGRQKVLK